MQTSLEKSHARRPRHLPVFALALIVALALPASALAGTFTLTKHIPNHTPTVNKPWPITILVTKGKAKLSGSVRYEFLFDGSVVSHQPGHKFRNGVYRDTMLFPSKSVGEPLTLRILVTTKYGTEHIDWKVTAQK
jgi:hypothetical protein